jgi:AcrR family transcriptional regulator
VPRPSLASVRRDQILDGLARCLAARGLEATSLDAVAAEAGVARPVIRHYFGNRDALLAAAVERAIAAYRADLDRAIAALPPTGRLDAFLDHLFLGEFTSHAERDQLFRSLFAAITSNAPRALLRDAYRRFEDVCFAELRSAAPAANTSALRSVAYALMCLAEQNADFVAIGFAPERARAARDAAGALVRSLADARPRRSP